MKVSTPLDEVEPCLRTSVHNSPNVNSSVVSAFSSVSHRRPDYARRCILVLLIHAIFILAIFSALYIGHWISHGHFKNVTFDESPLSFPITTVIPNKLPPRPTQVTSFAQHYSTVTLTESRLQHSTTYRNPITITSSTTVTSSSVVSTTVTSHTRRSKGKQSIRERLIPLSAVKNYTLEDVHPPIFEQYEFMEVMHAAFPNPTRDFVLVPLPTTVLPTHYDLRLDFTRAPSEQIVCGNVTVYLHSFGNSTDEEVVFHSGPRMKLNRIRLRLDGKTVNIAAVKQEMGKRMTRLKLKHRLKKGKYTLDIDYCTPICQPEGGGVHCSRAQQTNASSPVLSFTTKFEPALARNFFPCWDEPSIKATFNMTVLHDARLTVLSNMAAIREGTVAERVRRMERRGEKRMTTTRYQETPPMSTYLVAFAVGEFIPLEMRTDRNIPITIWTTKEDYLAARFAANFAPTMMDRHEEELEVLYPLPKMDLVAAHTFPVGAMENWGLIVFEAQSLLLDPVMEESLNMTVDRLFHEYRIEKIITHELAHQWFGNLVTMRDWSEIWLNEGFATYFVFDFLQEEHPRLTENEYFTRLAELVRKQTGHEHPALVRNMVTEAEVEGAFHTTNLYTKGCVVVRMIKDLVSEYDFRSGIRRYLKKNAYSSVSREDLWASLPAYADHGADNERLADVIEPWLVNEGIPEVIISRSYDTYMIRVTQRKSKLHRYKVFLHDEKMKDEAITARAKRSATTDDGRRFRTKRSNDGTPFNDDLFDDLPRQYLEQMKKRKHTKKHRKASRAHNIRPSPDILIESRKEDLRKTRRVREPSDLWSIPFSYMFGSIKSTEGQNIFEVVRQFWLHNRTVSFADVELAPSQPLLANPDWGYPFRVNYDRANWKMIARLLHQSPNEVPSKSRMQLIVDSELYLSQSNVPHLYIYILGYLAHESELGVALMGLDAVYRLVDSFRGMPISSSLFLYLSPVVSQFDKLLDESQSEPDLAALWLIEPTRLSKLYQLRCATNLPSCQQDEQSARWMKDPSFAQDDIHKQVTAVCHYFFTRADHKEITLISSQLRAGGTHWSINVQLAACVRDRQLTTTAAKQIVATKNAAVYASSLQSDFSLHYNQLFRTAVWIHIGKLPLEERRLLFSVNSTTPQPASKILLHAVRTTEELKQVRSLIPDWGSLMSKHLEYLERQLQWQTAVSQGVLREFFYNDATI